MATMAELKQGAHNSALVRKVLSSVGFYAPYSGTSMPTAYFDPDGGLAAAPADFNPLGMTEKEDAWTFAADTDTEEVEAHGYASAVRVDITSTTRTVAATFLETRKETLELATGADLSSMSTSDGSVEVIEPDVAARPYGRLVIIGSDGIGADEWFFVREYPRVQVTEVAEQSWGTAALTYGITWTAYPDQEAGYSVRQVIGGPGAAAQLTAMGFGA